MTWPLIILSGLALVAGAFNAHAIFHSHWFDDFVNPVFHLAEPYVKELEGAEALATTLLAPGILAFLVGAGVAYWMFVMEKGKPAAQLAAQLPRLHQWALDKWRIDELYEETVIGAVDSLAEICVWIDKWVVDGIIARLTALVVAVSGAVLRFTQTGHVHAYAATMVFGVLGLGWFVAVPHAEAQTVADHRSGEYKLSAAPGLGYQYRWDQDGDGEWDTKEFGDQTKVQFSLARDTKRTVKLEVKNAFGRTAVEVFEIERPKEDRSAPPARIVVEHDEQGGVHGHLVGEPTQRHAAPRPRPGGRPPSDRGRRPGRGVQR
jgi:NADH-quinone oxidoreductase subunit L